MLSHNSSQAKIIPNYYSSEGMFGANPLQAASQDQYAQSNIQGNNNVSYNHNNSKPVSKISAPSHGKHSSLYEKNQGIGQQNQPIIRLPSIGQLSSTKALGINPLSPNECGSLFDTENRFINSCSSAQQKKRMIRVQSKNKFPSDFFNENCEQTQQYQGMDDNSQQSNTKFFQSPDNNIISTPQQQRFSNPQIQVNQLKLSQHSLKSLENQQSIKQFDLYAQDYNINNIAVSPQSIIDDCKREFSQLQSPQNAQNIQRPFISAMGSRSAKSPSALIQQQNAPLNQLKKDFQFSKNNFIEQQYDMPLNPQSSFSNITNNQAVKTLGQKQLLTRTNLTSSGSAKRLISAQLPSASAAVSPSNTFRMLSPTEKQTRLVSPSSCQQNQRVQAKLGLKQSTSIQPQNSEQEKEDNSIQEINIQEIRSCTKDLSIPNSPKNNMNSSMNNSVQKITNKTNLNTKQNQDMDTPKTIPNQKNYQHPPMSQQIQRPKAVANNHKRTPNYDVKSSANLHEAINKGSFSCKNNVNDKKDKLFSGSQKEHKDTENNSENQEIAATKFISRKPVVVNKSKGGNIDFTNFKMPLSTMNRKIKEISVPNIQERQSGKSATVIMPQSTKQKQAASSSTPTVNNADNKKRKQRALSSSKLQSYTVLPEQTPKSLLEVQIEEQIEDQQSFNAEHAKEEQTYEGENSDTTKNSFQQNNTISLNSPSIQHDNYYLFSDKHIQSTQNSMLALPPPQLKQFYSEQETSNFNIAQSPSLNYQNTFSIPNQMNIHSEENIFALDQNYKASHKQQNFSQNNSNQYKQVAEFNQDQDFEQDVSSTNNNYNRTANFNPCNNIRQNEVSSLNSNSKLKSSQKSLPKIALNFKESEKYKPFLIRKVSSQCSMRVKGNLNNYSSNSSISNQSNNIVFDFNKNGSASTTHGKSMISTPTLQASNEYINSHEFSFSNN